MRIAYIASEVFPFAKTGGLGEVSGTLPKEISVHGHDVKVFMPKYSLIKEVEFGLQFQADIGEIPIRINGQVHSVYVHKSTIPNSSVEIYFIDCSKYFHRETYYTHDWDEDERWMLFSKGVIELIQRLQWTPDIMHCNDWQTGLIPLMLRENYSWDRMFNKTATVFTIHNIAYQGKFSINSLRKAEIKTEHSIPGGLAEHNGDVNFLKTALLSSDIISTVSETYSNELLTKEYGEGMEGYISARRSDLYGILNGVDYTQWNPEIDMLIPARYSITDLSGKLKNKKFLLESVNLPFNENIPLIGIVSRLVSQKGFDLLAYGIHKLMHLPVQWVILGNGEPKYEEFFRQLAHEYSHKASVQIGFNNQLSHIIEAGADIFLMPSRFEPCGLNQIYSLKYGTVPIVRKTGGLADTVLDWNEHLHLGFETGNGFSFVDYSTLALINSVERAINDFHNKATWKKIQLNGMNKDFSWNKSAGKYVRMYEIAAGKRKGF